MFVILCKLVHLDIDINPAEQVTELVTTRKHIGTKWFKKTRSAEIFKLITLVYVIITHPSSQIK